MLQFDIFPVTLQSLVASIMLQKIVFCFECLDTKCNETDSCAYSVGVLKLSLENRNLLNSVISFINNKSILLSDTSLVLEFFPSNVNQSTAIDISSKKLVSSIGDEILESNIVALIGPDASMSVMSIHGFSVLKNIPHIVPLASSTELRIQKNFPLLIRLVPSEDAQIQALIDIIAYHRYSTYSVIYSQNRYAEEQYRLVWFQAKNKKLIQLTAHRLQNNIDDDFISIALQAITQHRPHAIVLLCDSSTAMNVFRIAHRLNMVTSNGWIWLVTDSLSSNDKLLPKLSNERGNFDGIQGVRPASVESYLMKKFRSFAKTQNLSASDFTFDLQKYADGLLAIAHGISQHCNDQAQGKRSTSLQTLRQSILAINVTGFTGEVSFDQNGKISSSTFSIVQSINNEWLKIGSWNNNQLFMNEDALSNLTSSPDVTFHLNVTTIEERPFVYFPNVNNKKEPSELQGYCIDVLKELSKRLSFTYTLKLVEDGQYGAYDPYERSWNGLIGKLKRNEAELAIGSVTATKERGSVVNFLPPFLDVGLKFMYNKTILTKHSKYNPFAFLFPFSLSLYCAIIVSVVLMAVFLSLFSKLSPYGVRGSFFLSKKADQLHKSQFSKLSHRAKRQLQEDKKDAERGMGINNALYFVWAALFWQTPERVPRSVSARVVTVAWYLAAVVFLASYTANMVAVISTHADKIIESLRDLMHQSEVKYGTVSNSAISTVLASSDVLLAKRLHHQLWHNPSDHFVSSFNYGLGLVRDGKFSLLWDSISLDYAAFEANCNLKTVDVAFGMVHYAFATSKNSIHFNALSSQMLRLKEHGFMNRLYAKYFSNLTSCDSNTAIKNKLPRQLSFRDLAGIFYLVGISMAAGLLILAGEWITVSVYDVDKSNPRAPKTIKEAFTRRRNRLVDDFKRNWFPVESFSEKWSRLALPTQHLAEKVIERRLSKTISHLHHTPVSTSKSQGYVALTKKLQ